MTFLTNGQADMYRYASDSVVQQVKDAIDLANKEYLSCANYTIEASSLLFPTKLPAINRVIFNFPATVVLWSDGTKTVVKCGERDEWDPEKGLAMAIAKKAMGNKGSYNKVFKKWVYPDYDEPVDIDIDDFEDE